MLMELTYYIWMPISLCTCTGCASYGPMLAKSFLGQNLPKIGFGVSKEFLKFLATSVKIYKVFRFRFQIKFYLFIFLLVGSIEASIQNFSFLVGVILTISAGWVSGEQRNKTQLQPSSVEVELRLSLAIMILSCSYMQYLKIKLVILIYSAS